MPNSIHLCLTLHNHQPIGNFDGVFQQAYEDSYLPFLEIFEQFPELSISLHTSGPLMEWLDQHHGDYLDRVAKLVTEGRIEIVGGAFYEPILTMIPSRDRVGQITRYSQWLTNRLGAEIKGMWVPERVWEQPLTSDLARSGINYTILDDFHFRNAGLNPEQLHGYYVTENDGDLLQVFPGSEHLRYLLPFREPHETIDHLRHVAEQHPNAIAVFGDDGEKFGTWPDTKQHVYENGWLRRFFQALTDNRDWLHTSTLSTAVASTGPLGKIYIPEGSYREMTEWALPVAKQTEYDHLSHDMANDPRWSQIQRFVRGGYWRNFKVKYPETSEMYARMMMVSRRLEDAHSKHPNHPQLEAAKDALYRGQCNCSYWHGAFGGIYLPHLRNAVYQQLIEADNLLDQIEGRGESWIDAEAGDHNLDSRPEVSLANNQLFCLLAPHEGGRLYELDVRSICQNLLSTLARRPESYHDKVLAGPSDNNGDVASIHDRVVFKQEGLDQQLYYDNTTRKSLIDRFYAEGTSLDQVACGQANVLADLAETNFEAVVRRNPDRIQVMMTGSAIVQDREIRITKGVTLSQDSSQLEIAYLMENVPQDRPILFGTELNFACMPAGADDRYFYVAERERMGQLGSQLDLNNVSKLGLVDEWLGIDVQHDFGQPTGLWTYPVNTVSQSEAGFELVHQSVCVTPHWHVLGDAEGKWSATFTLNFDTSLAKSRLQPSKEAVTA